ncbi:MAG: hypothetical protein HAW59_01850, partial [Betaproteobacteria bacterium]|nr:hypothetical protein [Betaproteobacteria bacterium]
YKFTPPSALRRGVEIRKANFRGAERDNEKSTIHSYETCPYEGGRRE